MSIRPNNIQLEDWLDPYVEGTPVCPAGAIFEGGEDIRTKYAPIEFGSKGPNLGVLIGGTTDISNYFAAKGTAIYIPPAPWRNGTFTSVVGRDTGAPTYAKVVFEFLTSGIFNAYRNEDLGEFLFFTGRYLPVGATSAQYEAICTLNDGSPLVLNELSSWTQLSTNRYIEQRSAAPGVTVTSHISITVRKIGTTRQSVGDCQINCTLANY